MCLPHRNIETGQFSGLAKYSLKHDFYFNSILEHFLIPMHPEHIRFYFLSLSLRAVLGISQFEAFLVKNKQRLAIGHFHHQQHYRYFDCNYGAVDMPLDKWFGIFHDGRTDTMARIRATHKLLQHGSPSLLP